MLTAKKTHLDLLFPGYNPYCCIIIHLDIDIYIGHQFDILSEFINSMTLLALE